MYPSHLKGMKGALREHFPIHPLRPDERRSFHVTHIISAFYHREDTWSKHIRERTAYGDVMEALSTLSL